LTDRAWRADTIDAQETWYEQVPRRFLAEVANLLGKPGESPTAVMLSEEQRASGREIVRPIAEALEQGRGFVLVESPALDLDDRQRILLYWLIGQALGKPVAQNVQGTLLYDVRDTGQDVRHGARFSVTNAESSFHTDASFWDEIVDYVGLLCLKTARVGGLSQIVSGHSARQQLMVKHPEVLAILSQPFHVDRRGGARPEEAATARFPVLSQQGNDLVYRYLRYWIEAGHEKVGEPLSAAQKHALDALDEVLSEQRLRVEFTLRPGEMFFLNNRWTLHNRTAFEDFAEPERRRHLVRLWLRAS
jgi:alpha-ketoglutarate-dependent taurine dioxygenase